MLRNLAVGLLAAALVSLVSLAMRHLYLTTWPGKVTGKVYYDGKPVPIGTISFYPARGWPISVEIENGQYTAVKVPPGSYTITVRTAPHRRAFEHLERYRKRRETEKANKLNAYVTILLQHQPLAAVASSSYFLPPPPPFGGMVGNDQREDPAELWAKYKDVIDVPEEFADPETSDLTYRVTGGQQEFDIDLPKK